VRTSLMPCGQQVDLGADQVRDLKGLLARQDLRRARHGAAATSALHRASISPTSSPRRVANSKSMRPSSGSMLPPVT
jgi:hypothetical protein